MRMNPPENVSETTVASATPAAPPTPTKGEPRSALRFSLFAGLAFLAALVAFLGRDIYSLGVYAAGVELHSHIILVPLISAYLIYVKWSEWPAPRPMFSIVGALLWCAGVGAVLIARSARASNAVGLNDYFSLIALAVVLLVWGAGFFLFGGRWMMAAVFPMAFLIFGIPLPDGVADALETASKYGSAEVANLFYLLTGTTAVREGLFFHLPGISLEVAQECSGIRSSWVLLITSVLASYLFLNSPTRRLVLVFAVIPLGLLRNGLRILVISLLCIHIHPDMIHSVIHRRGGPVFFVLSLIPLFALLWWLRRSEKAPQRRSEKA